MQQLPLPRPFVPNVGAQSFRSATTLQPQKLLPSPGGQPLPATHPVWPYNPPQSAPTTNQLAALHQQEFVAPPPRPTVPPHLAVGGNLNANQAAAALLRQQMKRVRDGSSMARERHLRK
eukprot:1737318-Prymnesium_polylepis.1